MHSPDVLHPRAKASFVLAALATLFWAAPASAAFTDVSSASGVTLADHTYGLGWGDFDNDEDFDLLVVRHFYRPIVYRNNGVAQFNFVHFPPLFDPSDHHGPLIADFDEDGDMDIYLTSGADGGMGDVPKRMYRNDGTDEGGILFQDVAQEWGVADTQGRGRSSSAMDVNGDGALDIFVAKGPRVISPNSLFMNDGTQQFTDMAAAMGVADSFGSVGAVWGDYDNDRDPDLLIGGEENVTYETRLYRNDGGTHFTNVTPQMLPGIQHITAADWGDCDGDGDLDLAIGFGDEAYFDAVTWDADTLTFFFNARGTDNGLDGFAFVQTGDSASYDLYTNGFYQSSSVFISEEAYHPGPVSPFKLGFENYGAPEFTPGVSTGIYVWTDSLFGFWQLRGNAPPGQGITFAGWITTNGDIQDVGLAEMEPYSHGFRGTRLYRNDQTTFTDITQQAGIADVANVRQLGWLDYDLDGRLDLFVMNKGDTEVENQPDLLYRRRLDGTYENVADEENLEGPTKGLGDAFAIEDIEGDGDYDIAMLSGAGPRFFSLQAPHRLYRNDGPTGRALRVDLEGTLSTKDGYGAWVTCVSASTGRQTRYVTGNSWRGGHVPLEPVFGLGSDAVAETVKVVWPSTAITILTDVLPGTVVVTEGEPMTGAPALAEIRALAIDARPNPSSSEFTLSIAGRQQVPAELSIFDPAGRVVAVRRLEAGVDRVSWDGRTKGGTQAASGIYFARLREGKRSALARIVLLR